MERYKVTKNGRCQNLQTGKFVKKEKCKQQKEEGKMIRVTSLPKKLRDNLKATLEKAREEELIRGYTARCEAKKDNNLYILIHIDVKYSNMNSRKEKIKEKLEEHGYKFYWRSEPYKEIDIPTTKYNATLQDIINGLEELFEYLKQERDTLERLKQKYEFEFRF